MFGSLQQQGRLDHDWGIVAAASMRQEVDAKPWPWDISKQECSRVDQWQKRRRGCSPVLSNQPGPGLGPFTS